MARHAVPDLAEPGRVVPLLPLPLYIRRPFVSQQSKGGGGLGFLINELQQLTIGISLEVLY